MLDLRAKSSSYLEIIDEIERQTGVRLSKSCLSGWIRGTHSPLGSATSFEPTATPELAYVIGTETGDASLNATIGNSQYRIRLKAKDRSFVEEFDRAVSATLNCGRHRIWKTKDSEYYVEIGSYFLYGFLRRPLEELKCFVEHCEECVAAFVRGFFDSEGSVSKSGELTAYNTDLELLGYVKDLMFRFLFIESTGPHLNARKGSLLVRRGKSYYRNSDCFFIYVRKKSLATFYKRVGLTIPRKRVRLEPRLGLGSTEGTLTS